MIKKSYRVTILEKKNEKRLTETEVIYYLSLDETIKLNRVKRSILILNETVQSMFK